jgi:uncharacterized membrane protein YfcA
MLVAMLVVALTSAVHGATGFGMNLLAVPVLVVIDPGLVPGPTLVAGLLLSALVAARERHHPVDARLVWAGAGLLPGALLALALLAALSEDTLSAVTGVLVLVAVALTAVRLPLVPSPRTLCVAGLASGFMTTAASIGGPPLALVYADESGPQLRSNLSAFFVPTAAVSLVLLARTGHLGQEEIIPSLLLASAAVLGFAACGPLRAWTDRAGTRSAVLALSAVAGLIAVGNGLVQ